MTPDKNAPSLENLSETLDLGEEVLDPGGLDTTGEGYGRPYPWTYPAIPR